jgi:hypothetical protein
MGGPDLLKEKDSPVKDYACLRQNTAPEEKI